MPNDLDQLNQRASDLAVRFDQGELTAREYHEALAPIDNARTSITRQIDRAEVERDMAQATFVNVSAKRFIKKHPEYTASETALTALDAEVRRLQAKAIESGDDPYDAALLSRAHKNIQLATGHASRDEEGEEEAGEVDFDALDALAADDPTAFEEALATMSPADRDEYLRQS